MINFHSIDQFICLFDRSLRTVHSVGAFVRPYPPDEVLEQDTPDLTEAEQHHAAALMRVNHVGEVCAQALYTGQALMAKTPAVKAFNEQSALEEQDHLLWTAKRLHELNARPSRLNVVWYAGALGLGVLAGALGDRVSLAFVKETEAQVEAHLHSHEALLSAQDNRSRLIVAQMKQDEAAHGQQASELGGFNLPAPVKHAMRLSAKLMTRVAYHI
jgi:3-demethoxyubiquinol 3-hydroxylase